MGEHKQVRLFRDGGDQTVRIPADFELSGDEAIIHREGERLVIEPIRKRGLVTLLQSMEAVDEPFPDLDDPAPTPESML